MRFNIKNKLFIYFIKLFIQVTAISFIIQSEDFHPEKYRRIGTHLLFNYLDGKPPSHLVQALLQLAIRGQTDLLLSNEMLTMSSLNNTNLSTCLGSELISIVRTIQNRNYVALF